MGDIGEMRRKIVKKRVRKGRFIFLILNPSWSTWLIQHIVFPKLVITIFRGCQYPINKKSFPHVNLDIFITISVKKLWKTQWK